MEAASLGLVFVFVEVLGILEVWAGVGVILHGKNLELCSGGRSRSLSMVHQHTRRKQHFMLFEWPNHES